MARFRVTVPGLFGTVAMIACALCSAAVALAQVPPVGATAEVRDATGRLLANVQFREGRGEVLITMFFPSPPVLTGTHGLRITAVGRCDPPDFTSAGDGFNPTNKKHGRQNPEGPQVGDLPNVNLTNSLSSYNTSAVGATLGTGQASLLGPNRAVLIYSGEDDQMTDPDGKAGPRIGCGIITAAPGGAGAAAQPTAAGSISSPVAAQPAPAKPASSPVVGQPPVVQNPALAKPGTSPIPAVAAVATPTLFVPAVAVPTPPPVAATATQTGASLGTGPALLIAIMGLGLIVAGYLLRHRRQLTR